MIYQLFLTGLSRFFNLIVIFFIAITLSAQAPKIDFTNPEAYSFMKYVEQPVDLYHGIPEITVPVYTIKLQDFEFPISLSYHAGGIKVSEEASEVGLGWNLNAYGVITQKVNGQDDLNFPTRMYGMDWPIPDLISTNHVFELQNCFGSKTLSWEGLSDSQAKSFTGKMVCAPKSVNTQVDLFYYKFGSFSGSFYYDFNEKEFVDNKDPSLKITGSISGFQITDRLGNIFYFNERQQNNIFSNPISGYGGHSFYLSRITTKYNQTITFEYQTNEEFTQLIALDFEQYRQGEISGFPHIRTQGGLITNPLPTANYYFKALEKIKVSNGSNIAFIRSDRVDMQNTTRVDEIVISYGTKTIQKYKLDYSYFESTDKQGLFTAQWGGYTDERLNKRLKLNSILKVGDKPYVFTYYENKILPNKSSRAVDIWGYYNGISSNSHLLPDLKYLYQEMQYLFTENNWQLKNLFNLDAPTVGDRRFNKVFAKACLLTKIQYPTGGHSEYVFEPHTFSNKINAISASQSLYDYNGNSVDTDPITITLAEKTLINVRAYFVVPQDYQTKGCSINNYDFYAKISSQDETYEKYWFPNIPTGDNNGSSVKEDDLILESGTYTFSVHLCDKIKYVLGFTGQAKPNVQMHIRYGVLPEIQSGSGFRIKEIINSEGGNVSFSYTKENSNESSGVLLDPPLFLRNKSRFDFVEERGIGVWYLHGSCDIWELNSTNRFNSVTTYSRAEKSEQNNGSTIYSFFNTPYSNLDGAHYPSVIPSLESPLNGSLHKVEIRDNNSQLKLKKSFDYYETNKRYIFNGYLEKRHRAVYVVESTSVPGNTLSIRPTCSFNYGSVLYLWRTTSSNLELKKVTEEEFFENSPSIKKETTMTYDSYLNKTSETTKNSEGLTIEKRVYFTNSDSYYNSPNYNDGQNFMDIIVMADKNMISYPFLETTKVDNKLISRKATIYSAIDISKGVLYLPTTIKQCKGEGTSCLSSTFSYNTYGKLIKVQKENDFPTSYIWGYNNTYPVVKAEGANYEDLSTYVNDALADIYSSVHVPPRMESFLQIVGDMKGGHEKWAEFNDYLFANLPASASVTTYTYAPLLGMTSQTDANGVTTYYEYDDFGRLEFIKDDDGNVLKKHEYNYGN